MKYPPKKSRVCNNTPKRNKLAGNYNLLLDAGDILAGHLTDLFNGIFNSGTFLTLWSTGILVPFSKKEI